MEKPLLFSISGRHCFGYFASVAADVQQRAGPGDQAEMRHYRETAEEGSGRGRWGLCRGVSLQFALLETTTLYFFLTAPAASAPAKPFDTLQDSQLFDAENSEPLPASGGGGSSSQDWPQHNPDLVYTPASPERWQSRGSSQRHRPRGTESAVLYGV